MLTAEGGPEGIAMAKGEQVDGALIDVNMPGMNGITVCRELRAQAVLTGRPLPIWMMTGARTPEVAKSAVEELGAFGAEAGDARDERAVIELAAVAAAGERGFMKALAERAILQRGERWLAAGVEEAEDEPALEAFGFRGGPFGRLRASSGGGDLVFGEAGEVGAIVDHDA